MIFSKCAYYGVFNIYDLYLEYNIEFFKLKEFKKNMQYPEKHLNTFYWNTL